MLQWIVVCCPLFVFVTTSTKIAQLLDLWYAKLLPISVLSFHTVNYQHRDPKVSYGSSILKPIREDPLTTIHNTDFEFVPGNTCTLDVHPVLSVTIAHHCSYMAIMTYYRPNTVNIKVSPPVIFGPSCQQSSSLLRTTASVEHPRQSTSQYVIAMAALSISSVFATRPRNLSFDLLDPPSFDFDVCVFPTLNRTSMYTRAAEVGTLTPVNAQVHPRDIDARE